MSKKIIFEEKVKKGGKENKGPLFFGIALICLIAAFAMPEEIAIAKFSAGMVAFVLFIIGVTKNGKAERSIIISTTDDHTLSIEIQDSKNILITSPFTVKSLYNVAKAGVPGKETGKLISLFLVFVNEKGQNVLILKRTLSGSFNKIPEGWTPLTSGGLAGDHEYMCTEIQRVKEIVQS